MTDQLELRLRDLLIDRGRADPAAVSAVLDVIETLPRRHAAMPTRILAAVIAIALIGLVGFIAFRSPGGTGVTVPPGASDEPVLSTPTPVPSPTGTVSPTAAQTPVWVADLAGQLECDGPPSEDGQEVDNPSPMEPASTPDEALQTIRLTYSSLPATGYAPTEVEDHWARHRYLVDGRVKVIAVSTDRFEGIPEDVGWEVVGVRYCDPSEFTPSGELPTGQTIWLDAGGDPARTDVITSFVGPEHCGWQSAEILTYDGIQYFRDPDGLFLEYSVGRFDADASLPADAVDTGYHTPDWQLFTVPAGDAIFVRTARGAVERWPRAQEPVGCV